MFMAQYSTTAKADWRRRMMAPCWAALIVGGVIFLLAMTVLLPVRGAALVPILAHADISRDAEARATTVVGDQPAVGDRTAVGDRIDVGYRSEVGNPPAVGSRLVVGDRLGIGVFEKYTTMEQAEQGAALATLVERSEISGEQTIQADGTVMAPFIGALPAASMSATAFEAVLAEEYAAVLGGEISVVVRIVEREPVYVTGAIPSSAALDYRPNMIVMHAIAVTGTDQRAGVDDWQRLDIARERVRMHQARTRLVDLLGRASVLLTNAGRPDTASDMLAAQVGQQEAERRLAEARRVFELEDAHRTAEIRAAEQSAELIEEELGIVTEGLGDAEADMRLKSERASQFEAHLASGLTSDNHVQIVRNERAEAINRWNSMRATRSRLERNLAEVRQTAIRIELERIVDQEQEIQSLRAAIAQEEQVLESLAPMLGARPPFGAGGESEQDLEFEIVRRTPAGIERLEADLYTPLQPGDILDVKPRSGGRYAYLSL